LRRIPEKEPCLEFLRSDSKQMMSYTVHNNSKDPGAAATNDRESGETKPADGDDGSQRPDKRRIGLDERRILDALEDDEVREILRANRKSSP
jgi:hypothetical protein